MSSVEDPTATLVRLLRTYMLVVKDDGSKANIHVSQERHDRELLKKVDGQVTVGSEHSDEHKLSFDGNLRRRMSLAHVNVWVLDKPEQDTVGRKMRDKIRSDVNRAIREKRNKPNTANYDYAGLGNGSTTHKIYQTASATEPSPSDVSWSELAEEDYRKLWYSEDDRFSKSTVENGEHVLMLFRFKIDADRTVLKRLVVEFEGYGTAPSGNGVTIEVWNTIAETWQNAVTGTGENDETLTVTIAANPADYVDDDGFVFLLAETTNSSDGIDPAVLFCDYAEVEFTVNGITYADVVSYRDIDEVRVKPFVWRTEFTVKTWLFESVPVT
jgi:hypothetical protein